MRWLLTNHHPLADALRAAGEDVVSTPVHHQLAAYDWLEEAVAEMDETAFWTGAGALSDPFTRALAQIPFDEWECDPGFYDIGRWLKMLDPDVLVITPMLQAGLGVSKGPVLKWANQRGRSIVGVGHDPGTVEAANANRWRGCSINLHNLHVYVTDEMEAGQQSARSRRTVVWRPGEPLDALLATLRHARASRPYQAGRRAKPFHGGNMP